MKTNRASHVGWLAILALPVACSHQQPPAAQKPPAAVSEAVASAGNTPKLSSADDNGKTGLRPNAPAAVFFDFDSALLKPDARDALAKTANQITARHVSQVTVEGNCDELGTVEYNLALGQQRAESAKDYLAHMGVDPGRIKTTSYGSQHPRFPGHDEVSRARNRRDDVVYQ